MSIMIIFTFIIVKLLDKHIYRLSVTHPLVTAIVVYILIVYATVSRDYGLILELTGIYITHQNDDTFLG